MRVLLLQYDIAWQSPAKNFATIEGLLRDAGQPFDLCVLPEMFSTGFTMTPAACPTDVGERSRERLLAWSQAYGAGFCGSTVYAVEGGYANRMLFAAEGAVLGHYDKRHLFRMAGEADAYVPGGPDSTVVTFGGWRFLLQVCYDLRFPVASSNAGDAYDAAIYVANWPSPRRLHWSTLLRARAIENQAYVIGVNRVGKDGNDYAYAGDTAAYDPLGAPVTGSHEAPGAYAATLDLEHLRATRERLPFLRDADRFALLP